MTRYLSAGVSTAAALWAIPLRLLACLLLGCDGYENVEALGTWRWCLRCGRDLP